MKIEPLGRHDGFRNKNSNNRDGFDVGCIYSRYSGD